MTVFDKDIAIRAFEAEPASKEACLVVSHWLSAWRGALLPLRSDFKPKAIQKELHAIAIFDVLPDVSVRCRLFGSGLARGLGQDITGQDWLALTRPEARAVRLQRWSEAARGAVGRGLRSGYRESGDLQMSEEILLPFADVAEDGSRQVLYHLSWRPSALNPFVGGMSSVDNLSEEFRLIPLQNR